ncbi:MAG: tyrosine-type recombinase/integrase [Calothrix sp. SM1_5_4]|nr:tyrosine-type recombinase/integrase [Calothrix sp. SM1_5_4]
MAIRTYIKDGKKLYEAYINGFDARGIRVQRKRKGIETLRKAEQVEFELKRELAQLKEEKIHPYFGEWLKECLGLMKVMYRPSTFYTYEKTINRWIGKHWTNQPMSEITKTDVHELIFEQIKDEDATMHTRKFVLKLVKRIFQLAVDHGKLDRNPCNGMTVKVPESDKKVLTNKEVEIFLQESKATNHRFYPVWVVALFTGMRSGELYALKWSDVDFESRTISVGRSWNSKNGFTSTKKVASRSWWRLARGSSEPQKAHQVKNRLDIQ